MNGGEEGQAGFGERKRERSEGESGWEARGSEPPHKRMKT